ncbi:hypothetical protein Tco_0222671 [Tanacetum coccineum]
MKFQIFIKNLRKHLVRHGTDSRISFEHALIIDFSPNCIQTRTFYNGLNPSDQDSLNSVVGGNLLERSAQDVLKIIENKSKVRYSRNKPIVSQVKASNVDSSEMAKLTDAVTQLKSMFGQFMKMNIASSLVSGLLPSNTVPSPQEDLKAITTWSCATLVGPLVPPPPPSPSKEVDRESEMITDQVLTGSTNNVLPPVVQPSPASTSSAPEIPEPNLHQPPIPYPLRLNK